MLSRTRIHRSLSGQAALGCYQRLASGNAGVPALLLLFLGCSAVGTVRQARDRPWDQAFAGLAYADLAALLLCVRRAEQLPRREPSPAGGEEAERRCLLARGVSAVRCPQLRVRLQGLADHAGGNGGRRLEHDFVRRAARFLPFGALQGSSGAAA
ncbi:hypothetical protein C2845_PM02G32690 [Panicum miliaceum]|uniref:Uncharacterized protein n=1 Tax=Panicum miliaceum TaxID=4540 RepID=A0A3L6SEQ9_PANMI|nr:hypothetical protein C2845_PM02G32690 [Panicum miliaceum]